MVIPELVLVGCKATACYGIACRDPGSNRGPSDLQSDALPTELSRLDGSSNVQRINVICRQPTGTVKFLRITLLRWGPVAAQSNLLWKVSTKTSKQWQQQHSMVPKNMKNGVWKRRKHHCCGKTALLGVLLKIRAAQSLPAQFRTQPEDAATGGRVCD